MNWFCLFGFLTLSEYYHQYIIHTSQQNGLQQKWNQAFAYSILSKPLFNLKIWGEKKESWGRKALRFWSWYSASCTFPHFVVCFLMLIPFICINKRFRVTRIFMFHWQFFFYPVLSSFFCWVIYRFSKFSIT